jgi:hypothetical protein
MALRTVMEDDVYEIPAMVDEGIPAPWTSGAIYTLEGPVRCPHCREVIQTLRIVGLTRSQASFTSTLPRKGRVVICPECDLMLSAELSGLV